MVSQVFLKLNFAFPKLNSFLPGFFYEKRLLDEFTVITDQRNEGLVAKSSDYLYFDHNCLNFDD